MCLEYQPTLKVLVGGHPGIKYPPINRPDGEPVRLTMRTSHTDEYIDHWGHVFVNNNIHRRYGVMFEYFLLEPEAILDATVLAQRDPLPEEYLPLLPSQLGVVYES